MVVASQPLFATAQACACRRSRFAAKLHGPESGAEVPQFRILPRPGADAPKSRDTNVDLLSQMAREPGGYDVEAQPKSQHTSHNSPYSRGSRPAVRAQPTTNTRDAEQCAGSDS